MIIVWLFVPIISMAVYAIVSKRDRFKTFKPPLLILFWYIAGFFVIDHINSKYQLNYTPVAHKVMVLYDENWHVLKRTTLY